MNIWSRFFGRKSAVPRSGYENWLINLPLDSGDDRTMDDYPALRKVPYEYENSSQECLEKCEHEITIQPDADLPYTWAANCLKAQGRIHDAEEILRRGICDARRKTLLLTDLAKLHHEQKNVIGMVECFVAATRTQRQNLIDHDPYLYIAYIAYGCSDNTLEPTATRAKQIAQSMGYDFEPGFANSLMQLANTKRGDVAKILQYTEWPK